MRANKRVWVTTLVLAGGLVASAAWGFGGIFNKPSGEDARLSNKDLTATVSTRLASPDLISQPPDILGDRLQGTIVVEKNMPKRGDVPSTFFVEIACSPPTVGVDGSGNCLGDPLVHPCNCAAPVAGCKVDSTAPEMEFCLFALAKADVEAVFGPLALDPDSVLSLGVDHLSQSDADVLSVFRAQLKLQ